MRQLFLIASLLFLLGKQGIAQFNTGGRFNNMGGGGGGTSKMQRDTTKHDHEPDTLTLTYRYLGEPTDFTIDSSIADFDANFLRRPASYMYLGNNGNAARNLIFTPRAKAGFDEGFHAFDIYAFKHEDAKFYMTTKPYSELQYLIGAKQEQLIHATHTQNRGERFNFSFDYRKVNAPGYFRNLNTNDDMYRVTAQYHSKNKRAHTYFSFYMNKLASGENGGIRSDTFIGKSRYSERSTIDVNLGNSAPYSSGFFNSTIAVKSSWKQTGILLQQHYDWGKGDTVHVNDTTAYYKFDPVFRVQYTFKFTNNTYEFTDNTPDTFYYTKHYDIAFQGGVIEAKTSWKHLSNDISLVQFPIRGNQAHFISAGARYENITGTFLDAGIQFNNLAVHGEYRNKTRNKKWDFSARGELYALGTNVGDYNVSASLSRYLNEKLGNVTLLFRNVNTEPSYIYRYFSYNRDSWYNENMKKENTFQFSFLADNKRLKYNLAVNYFVFTNYTYWQNYMQSAQASGVFNLFQVVFSKQFRWRQFTWYADFAYQQVLGNGPINVPSLYTRHRLAFERRLFTNLNLMTGIEAKYTSSYYADDYSPLTGQFIYQKNTTVRYNLPDLAAFVHFRIKSFSAYARAENLNTFLANNNYAAPLYPYNNFGIRVGLRWWFIN
ncbi:putative porin [Chitinophaga pendula]|uniref:putative porin n=1 Tax=Chitinophaga TaxID=79328 RepID=UPI000BB0B19E|nr:MULTISPECIES: putative porin [Chitinophaga]ASZ14416.1 hypothetical protein CK934_27470 [Chitinophaga sp. MD30]UCJ07930.1 putative porin [Chitinophaga pendula]